MTPRQAHRAELMRRAEGYPVCALGHRGGCGGALQAHHPIPCQRLRHEWETARRRAAFGRGDSPLCAVTLDDLIADADNGMLVCEMHHHAPHLTIYSDELPWRVERFADRYGLEWSLLRDYPERARAAA